MRGQQLLSDDCIGELRVQTSQYCYGAPVWCGEYSYHWWWCWWHHNVAVVPGAAAAVVVGDCCGCGDGGGVEL